MEKKCHICGENDTFTCNQCGKIVCSTHEYNGVCHICYEEEVEMLEDERELEEGYEDCPICEGNNGVYQGDVPNESCIESEYYCTNCERMCKTFITVLEHLGIEIGQVITLYDLDEIIAEKFPEMRTQLEDGLEADSVLDDREYKYWISDDDELGYDIYFEVVEDYQPDPVFTRIKII